MKATGIVRRIDDLGRVVIPREIRRNLKIKDGDPFEIFLTEDGGVLFKKYDVDPILSSLNDANECAIDNEEELSEKVRKAIAEAVKVYAEFKREKNDYFPGNLL